LLDSRLPPLLEDVRVRCGHRPVTVNSGYRTAAHNRRVGGAANSYHIRGQAADIAVAGLLPSDAAEAAEWALFAAGLTGGIGLYRDFVHVDVRDSLWRQNMVTGAHVPGFGPAARPTLRRGASYPAETRLLQEALNLSTGAKLTPDGVFGPKTELAVRVLQSARGLAADGIVGRLTWLSL
jgi:murein L,D-transpeptidase YcbB/YkuD